MAHVEHVDVLIAMATNRLECGNWEFEDNMYTPALGVKITKMWITISFPKLLVMLHHISQGKDVNRRALIAPTWSGKWRAKGHSNTVYFSYCLLST